MTARHDGNGGRGGTDPAGMSYEEAKRLARDGDPEVRRALAAREDMRAEILFYLAEDPDPEVRRRIAVNPNAPRRADVLLANDADDTVRSDLAAKIARLAPGLGPDARSRVRALTLRALETLARDEAVRVREILAQTLKDVADAPPEVIRRLARDAELAVAGPVLEHSPVLTDEDLLEIIRSVPPDGALSAISRRRVVTEPVADAIVGTDDVDALASLLGNPSAQIREETLDRLVERARTAEALQEPLVLRPRLPARAAVRLAQFVAERLVGALESRRDLDPDTLRRVRAEVTRRVSAGPDAGAGPETTPEPAAADEETEPVRRARRLLAQGRLTPETTVRAAVKGDRAMAFAALAVRSGLTVAMVRQIVGSLSAKAVLALAWKAGLDVHQAKELQVHLAKIPLTQVIEPPSSGEYPLDEAAMLWQLDLFDVAS